MDKERQMTIGLEKSSDDSDFDEDFQRLLQEWEAATKQEEEREAELRRNRRVNHLVTPDEPPPYFQTIYYECCAKCREEIEMIRQRTQTRFNPSG